MPAISVIMPVYNSGEKVNMAINSVLEQSFHDFELIIIDDGSTDNSFDICKRYANIDIRVKIIHQENKGLSAARNMGIEAASGKYLAFIDHDDFYLQTLLKENYMLAENTQADLVKFSYIIIDEKQVDKIYRNIFDDEIIEAQCIENEDLVEHYMNFARSNRLVYVWDALFRSELVKKYQLSFDESFKQGHEDIAFCMKIYPYITRMVINNKKYYIHIKYEKSTSKLVSNNFIKDTEKLLCYEKSVFVCTGLDLLHPEWWTERLLYYIHICIKYTRKPDTSFTRKDILLALTQLWQRYWCLSMGQHQVIFKKMKVKDKFFLKLFAWNKISILSYLLVVSKKLKCVGLSIGRR